MHSMMLKEGTTRVVRTGPRGEYGREDGYAVEVLCYTACGTQSMPDYVEEWVSVDWFQSGYDAFWAAVSESLKPF